MHVSSVTGLLQEGKTAFDALRLPAGRTLSGAPRRVRTCKSSMNWSRIAGDHMAAPSATLISTVTWTPALRSARWSSKAKPFTYRPGPVSWGTVLQKTSAKKRSPRQWVC